MPSRPRNSGGAFPAISTIGGLVARRRVDATGAVMLAALAVSAAFSLISGSPRALLAREALNAATMQENEKVRDALLDSLSHDLRTQLSTIAGAASSLRCSGRVGAARPL